MGNKQRESWAFSWQFIHTIIDNPFRCGKKPGVISEPPQVGPTRTPEEQLLAPFVKNERERLVGIRSRMWYKALIIKPGSQQCIKASHRGFGIAGPGMRFRLDQIYFIGNYSAKHISSAHTTPIVIPLERMGSIRILLEVNNF